MSLQYKAFLYADKPENTKEIRRFQIDHEIASSYEYLHQKIATIFPSLRETIFTLQWSDCDGDLIAFDSDDELMQLLSLLNGDLFKIYIKLEETYSSGLFGKRKQEGWKQQGPHGTNHQWDESPLFSQTSTCTTNPFAHFDPNAFANFPFFKRNVAKTKPSSSHHNPATSSSEDPTFSDLNTSTKDEKFNFQEFGDVMGAFLQSLSVTHDSNIKQDEDKAAKDASSPGENSSSSHETPKKRKVEHNNNKKKSSDENPTNEGIDFISLFNQLQGMGFQDDTDWLTKLLKTNSFDISTVLDAMQITQQAQA